MYWTHQQNDLRKFLTKLIVMPVYLRHGNYRQEASNNSKSCINWYWLAFVCTYMSGAEGEVGNWQSSFRLSFPLYSPLQCPGKTKKVVQPVRYDQDCVGRNFSYLLKKFYDAWLGQYSLLIKWQPWMGSEMASFGNHLSDVMFRWNTRRMIFT